MDIAFTLIEILNNFLEIFAHQFLVRHEFLCFLQSRNFVFVYFVHQDCHSVAVILSIEDDIETCFLEFLERDRVGAFREDIYLLNFLFFFTIDCNCRISDIRGRDKRQNLQIGKSKFQRVGNEKITNKSRFCTEKRDYIPALRACCRSL